MTENAHTAISELRWRGSAGLYWIDGLCIDQSNAAEKSEQVAFMGEIYKEAERVIVWLGTDEENDREAFKVIESHDGRVYVDIDKMVKERMRMTHFQDPEQFLQLSLDCLVEAVIPIYSILLGFFARSWFQRLWIIQEAVLAKKLWIICGGLHFDWEKICRVASHEDMSIMQEIAPGEITTRGLFGLSLIRRICKLRDMEVVAPSVVDTASREQRLGATFADLMPAFQNAGATDSRDRIYGPLSLACKLTGLTSSQLVPDYNQTVEHVFVTAAEYLLNQVPSLEMLSLVDASDADRSLALPSWVPDLRTRSRSKSITACSSGNATRGWPYYQPHCKLLGRVPKGLNRNSKAVFDRQTLTHLLLTTVKRYAGSACPVLRGLPHATLSEVMSSLGELLRKGDVISLIKLPRAQNRLHLTANTLPES